MTPTPLTFLVFEIEALEPFAVAAPEEAGAADLPVSTDQHGNVWIPPTSLAGSLRAHLASHGLDMVLMGPRTTPGADPVELTASPLWLLGTRTTLRGEPIGADRCVVRRQTAIDRRSGAARARSLRSQVVAPAGATVALWAMCHRDMSSEEVGALAAWRPGIGGSRTRGFGRARLAALRSGRLDPTSPTDFAQLMTRGGPDLVEAVATEQVPVADSERPPLLDVDVEIVDGFFTAGEQSGNRTEVYRRDGRPVIEASSLKGALRSRCEYLLRSLGYDACVDGTCGECRACALFGSTKRRGRIGFRAAPIEDARFDERPHVAIDRVTGGALSGRLFTEEFIVSGSLRIVVDDLGAGELPWAKPLLLWALRDLHEGLFGLGGRTTRGYGTMLLRDASLVDELPPLKSELEPQP